MLRYAPADCSSPSVFLTTQTYSPKSVIIVGSMLKLPSGPKCDRSAKSYMSVNATPSLYHITCEVSGLLVTQWKNAVFPSMMVCKIMANHYGNSQERYDFSESGIHFCSRHKWSACKWCWLHNIHVRTCRWLNWQSKSVYLINGRNLDQWTTFNRHMKPRTILCYARRSIRKDNFALIPAGICTKNWLVRLNIWCRYWCVWNTPTAFSDRW